MREPFQPSSEELQRGIEHVCYEYSNLLSASYHSLHGAPPWRTHADDAFLLGYRKVADFLLRDTRSQRRGRELPDILATDYLPSECTRCWSLPTWSTEWADAMDKQLAHISYVRDKTWDHTAWVKPLTNEMRFAWAQFYASIDERHRAEFHRQLELRRRQPGMQRLGF